MFGLLDYKYYLVIPLAQRSSAKQMRFGEKSMYRRNLLFSKLFKTNLNGKLTSKLSKTCDTGNSLRCKCWLHKWQHWKRGKALPLKKGGFYFALHKYWIESWMILLKFSIYHNILKFIDLVSVDVLRITFSTTKLWCKCFECPRKWPCLYPVFYKCYI